MEVKTMMLGDLQTNGYIVYDKESKDAVVIDPAANPDRIIKFVEENELKIMGLLVTHGHFDHILAIDKLRDEYGVPVFTSKEEKFTMGDPNDNLSLRFLGKSVSVKSNENIEDGDILEFGELVFECIKVPGHSNASICYYNSENKLLFSGDTLFASSIGRTDFYQGLQSTLVDKIKEKLLCLPDETKVYPGHGLNTTIGYEKKTNIYL
ncbi:MAG: MBL fold metallo-hydrolase [Vallitalea sp.]|jgi:glyoxylase-like metal-dependent hydrolase (beta-lactamase superfamily II)|nr:MBL fold metallo-hydrolase [Vallitalea sp.]